MPIYVNLDFQSWVLFSILIYVGVILSVVLIRRCILKRSLCPFSQYCSCCKALDCKCDYCERTHSSCCSKNETFSENSCLMRIPTCKCKCFLPDCSYCRCICCEIVCESEIQSEKRKELDLYFIR
ncbi:hypothetical protein ILUMI_24743 [Ignelater luminosus]|uniref:Uncharacterized protein n=1 Tax=Ignelater luminosus TaxID=2038154 RepID=A0A8K0FYH5_IGNLU|nr:hypothetical protein ILUMI_24743 [Ignelater luminosus]